MTIFAPEFSYSLFHRPGASSGLWSTYTKGWWGSHWRHLVKSKEDERKRINSKENTLFL